MKVKILKFFNFVFVFFIWIFVLVMDFVFFVLFLVKILLFKKGGMLREILLGKMFWIRKFLLVKIIFFGIRWFNRFDCFIMVLLEMDLGYNLLIKVIIIFGVISIIILNEYIFL